LSLFLAIVIELTEGWFNYRAGVILIELLPPGLIRASFDSDILNTGGSWILVSFQLLTTAGSDGSRVHPYLRLPLYLPLLLRLHHLASVLPRL
jgi:hypothetical protein